VSRGTNGCVGPKTLESETPQLNCPTEWKPKVPAAAVTIDARAVALDSRPASEIVKQRAEARWSSLVQGDGGATYEYLTPTVRKTLTRDDYVANMRGGFWKTVTVDRVVCEAPALCNVELTVEYDFKSRRNKSPLKETWIQEGSNWWYAQK